MKYTEDVPSHVEIKGNEHTNHLVDTRRRKLLLLVARISIPPAPTPPHTDSDDEQMSGTLIPYPCSLGNFTRPKMRLSIPPVGGGRGVLGNQIT